MQHLTIGQRALSDPVKRATKLERAFLDQQLLTLRSLESRARGLYAETLVEHHLGGAAHGSTYKASPWDLCWSERTISVRVSGLYNSESWDSSETDEPADSKLRWSFGAKAAYLDSGRLSTTRRRVWTDVVILGVHRGRSIDEGWSFVVISGAAVNENAGGSLGLSAAIALSAANQEIKPEDLGPEILNLPPVPHRRGFPVGCNDEPAHAVASSR